MNGSARLGRLFGVELRVHWTFLLLLVWVAGSYLAAGAGWTGALLGTSFVLAVFACVVLHELGHATAARQFGVETTDITLLPIGGVARLREIPEQPLRELWIAVAGPLVNVVIAAILAAVLATAGRLEMPRNMITLTAEGFLANLMWINLFLVAFNAIPAFPMDGGRVLRAALATRLPRRVATDLAARIGQVIAMGLGVVGLFGNPLLILVAVFVYFGAEAEASAVRVKSMLAEVPVSAALIQHCEMLKPDDPLQLGRDLLLSGSQQDFPVVSGDEVVGMLYRRDLITGLQQRGEASPVADAMHSDPPALAPGDELHNALVAMREAGVPALPVVQAGRLVGMVTQENIGELLMVREAETDYMDAHRAPFGNGAPRDGNGRPAPAGRTYGPHVSPSSSHY
jgi:Zn-dependent protease/CBS domain-containing protein